MAELSSCGSCQLTETPKTALSRLDDLSDVFLSASKSEATKAAYRLDWQSFTAWAAEHDLEPLPATPSTVRRWITHLAHDLSRAPATISRIMTSISQAHKILSLQSPTTAPEVVETFKGIKRTLGTAQNRAKPLMLSDLKTVVDSMRPTFLERRDTAMLLVGWSAALRRSEIVNLMFDDIDFVSEGMVVTIRASKTDQEKSGYRIGVPFARDERYCPTKRLKNWIDLAIITSGEPLFFAVGGDGQKFHKSVNERRKICTRSLSDILKKRIRQAGLSEGGYSGHSLRAGFVTEAAKRETPEWMIQVHTRHRTTKVLRTYIREGSLFNSNPLSILL